MVENAISNEISCRQDTQDFDFVLVKKKIKRFEIALMTSFTLLLKSTSKKVMSVKSLSLCLVYSV